MSRRDRTPAERTLSDAEDTAWDAAIEALIELGKDDPDFERVDKAGLEIIGAARRGKTAQRHVERDES